MFTAFEHESFRDNGECLRLTDIQSRQLDRINTAAKTDLIKIGRNNHIRATHHVGVLRLHNLTLQILPKTYRADSPPEDRARQATQNLLTMLAYAHDLPLIHHAAPLLEHAHDWLELLTRLFAATLRDPFSGVATQRH